MAYDEILAERVRITLGDRQGLVERKMFGGLAFMLRGNMCCGVIKHNLVLRLGEEGAAEALLEPHTRLMDFTGKPMKTMIYVSPDGYETDEALRDWIDRAEKFTSSLPAKGW